MQVVIFIHNTGIVINVEGPDERENLAIMKDIAIEVRRTAEPTMVTDTAIEIARDDITDFYQLIFDISLDYPVLIQ